MLMFLQIIICKFFLQCRIRKTLDKLRPPSVTEVLLSNNGDQILEGCVTNFFVVCCKVSLFDLSINSSFTSLSYARILFALLN